MAAELAMEPVEEPVEESALGGVFAMNGVASRVELTDRVRRVLPRLLADHRWPHPAELPRLLPGYVGAVLAEHPLTRFDRTAKLRVQGAAASYCWNYLPDDRWRLVELPPADPDGEDVAPPLFWTDACAVIADRLYCGIHRGTEALAEASWPWAAAWRDLLPAPVTAVRVLPLADQPLARLVTAEGVQPLAGSPLDAMGGVWR